MARRVGYTFKNQYKEINFSYDKYQDMFEAVAAAEGIDLSHYHAMAAQVAMTAKHAQAIKDYRQQTFTGLGLRNIHFIKDETKG